MSEETAAAPVEQAAAPSAAELAAEVERLRQHNERLLNEKKTIKDSRSADQAELERLRKIEADLEEAKLLEQGNFTEAKTKLQQQYDTEKAAWAAEREQLQSRIRDLELLTPASTALAAVVHDPEDVFKTGRLTAEQIESTPDGPVVVDGLTRTPIAEWAKAKLPAHYLKAPRAAGSGAPAGRQITAADLSGIKNPYSKEHFNLTERARLEKTDPPRAAALKAAAGL